MLPIAMAMIALVTLVGWLISADDILQELAYLGKGYNISGSIQIPPRTIHEGSSVGSVQWHPDGATFISGSGDNMVRIWDAATGNCLQTLTGHTGPVISVAYSPDGQHIVSGSDDNSIRVWDAHALGSIVV